MSQVQTESAQHSDLDVCESEQLAWTGTIQANGALLVTDGNGQLLRFSANLTEFFDTSADVTLVNTRLNDLFEDNTDYFSYREHAIFEHSHFLITNVTTNRGIAGDLVLSHHGGLRFYEFEPAMEAVDAKSTAGDLSINVLPQEFEFDLGQFLQTIYTLTNYPKIMVYRFLEDETGEVVAELNASSLDSYLGLRFPASDVPRIARSLYVQNPYRLIFDVDGATVPMQPIPGLDDPVDLTTTSLRSVSPIHLEYLRNMEVRSSASFSIRILGNLWGLLALHATEPTTIPVQNRGEIRGRVDALEHAIRNQHISEEHHRFNASAQLMETLVSELLNFSRGAIDEVTVPADIDELIDADDVVFLVNGKVVYQLANVPADYIKRLCGIAREHSMMGQFSSDSLSTFLAQDEQFRQQVSGLLYEGTGERDGAAPTVELLWLREEDAVNVDWAGKPTKIRTEEEGQVRISPRKSFDKWSDIARGQAIPWSTTDKQLASKLLAKLVSQLNK